MTIILYRTQSVLPDILAWIQVYTNNLFLDYQLKVMSISLQSTDVIPLPKPYPSL